MSKVTHPVAVPLNTKDYLIVSRYGYCVTVIVTSLPFRSRFYRWYLITGFLNCFLRDHHPLYAGRHLAGTTTTIHVTGCFEPVWK